VNELEHQQFEAQLRRATPAQPPEEFMSALIAAEAEVLTPKAESSAGFEKRETRTRLADVGELAVAPLGLLFLRFFRGSAFGFQSSLRWLLSVTAAVVIGAVLWRSGWPGAAGARDSSTTSTATTPLTADDIQFGQKLVSSFDTVARLPGGEPVRFRCRKWMDEVVVKDKARGLVIEKRTPRVEVVPVRYETY
jgi:hypothetical protein